MIFENSLITLLVVLFSSDLICAEDEAAALEIGLQEVGAKYCHFERRIFYVFGDTIYRTESEKYAELNSLSTLAKREYTDSVVYERTHLLALGAAAIVSASSEFAQIATGGIHDCVGLVLRQINPSDNNVVKTMVVHVDSSCRADKEVYFKSFSDIVEDFLKDVDPASIKVDFVTNYNTDHLLDVYQYLRLKTVNPENMTITGHFPNTQRPIYINRWPTVVYFPQQYYEEANNLDPKDPINEDFYAKYMEGMALFLDASGQLYPKIKDYLKGEEFDDRGCFPKQLVEDHPHIKIGLSNCINHRRYSSYFLVPNTMHACRAELARLDSSSTV